MLYGLNLILRAVVHDKRLKLRLPLPITPRLMGVFCSGRTMTDAIQPRLKTTVLLLTGLLAGHFAVAETVQVRVVDRDGSPVEDVAVYVEGAGSESTHATTGKTAVMDQVDKHFKPHILVVQKGTSVEFPNSDVVTHHVYSFSKPNDFVLPLYKGETPPPVTFDEPGVAFLGCNIHDNMEAYVVVVDSDIFGVTDESGTVELPVGDAGEYAIRIWSPRIRDADKTLVRQVTPQSETPIEFELGKKLRPPHDDHKDAIEWTEY